MKLEFLKITPRLLWITFSSSNFVNYERLFLTSLGLSLFSGLAELLLGSSLDQKSLLLNFRLLILDQASNPSLLTITLWETRTKML